MIRRIVLFFIVFCFFILVFFFQKILFILMHGEVNGGVVFTDVLQILYHGLPIDMSVSGYLTIFPAFLIIASIWIKAISIKKWMHAYFYIMLTFIAIITSADMLLYPHWGFHLDPIVFFYLRSPNEIIASGTMWEWIYGALITVGFAGICYFCYYLTIRKLFLHHTFPQYPVLTSLVLTLLTGALFLPIRGGITVSTMNISRAYFSDRLFLNHAAINPAFNFFYLLHKQDNFESQYQFYDKDEAELIFKRINEEPSDTIKPSLLRTNRPNIILFILESFSYPLTVDSIISPNLSRLAKEGILFKHFYANTFRTDRGLTSILSGYPAHPTTAILKYPNKTETLPSFPKHLRANGYENQSLYYGGDVNFANMRSYFVGSCKIRNIVSDKDFPVNKRLNKWGVPDQEVLDRVYRDLTETKQREPFLKIILTLSSHEPFDVPTKVFDEPFLNSIHYVDDCIGKFVADLRSTDFWDNTLIILIADHAMQSYPIGAKNYEKVRFHIPMIWIGGAIEQPRIISDYGSQNDLAATLLSQLRIDHSDFKFSKNMLLPHGRKFSFYSYVNGFCMMDSSSVYLFDNDQQRAIEQIGDPSMEKEAKSFFQLMYLDIGSR